MIKQFIKEFIRKRCCRKLHISKTNRIYSYKNINKLSCGEYVSINNKNCFLNCLDIGSYSCVSQNTVLDKVKVGKFSCLGPNIKMAVGEHPTSKIVGINPAFYSTRKQLGYTFVNKQKFEEFKYVDGKNHFVVGNDVWIGSNVILIEGHRIGDGAIIAAGSVVTKDIPPYEIWGGNPAKFIKKRFSDEQIKFLLNLKWWDWPIDKIKKNSELFEDIEEFIKNGEENKFKN